MSQIDATIAGLGSVLAGMRRVAVAVSGGVDSITLAAVAHRFLDRNATMFHAVSPAVPPEATERTRRHAERFGWKLVIIDAGEFSDPAYLRNPVNRCYFCKTNLYGAIAGKTRHAIVSGTNLDDLADYRPGLEAAELHRVRHPYVEAGIDKAMVRAIADRLDLGEMAALPASPCLSSRVETGIRVDAGTLALVHAVETRVSREVASGTVRCRVRRDGIVIELDQGAYDRIVEGECSSLRSDIESIGARRGFTGAVRFERYRMGSAFLRER